jgi:hypothetical protein
MYIVDVQVTGVAPLLEHRYPVPDFADLGKGSKLQTGSPDYTQEWRKYLYVDSAGQVFQPAAHFEGAMTKAAAGFKVTGKRGKTYKDLFSSSVFVTPDQIPHGIAAPQELDADADKPLYLDIRPVVVQRSRVVRIRPTFKPGWVLDFEITCIDDQIPSSVINEVLILAGRTVGIGDFRPKFGRFMVSRFEVRK